ncbi:MAG: type II secretion system F family protein [Planctomycetaceae bacterium]
MILPFLSTLMIGAAIGLAVYAGQDEIARGVSFVENDLREKLRRLRVSTQPLRTWIIVWTVAVIAVFLVFTVLWGVPVLGLMAAALLGALPWYVVRRLAEQRKLKIEDQLADAMVSLSSAIKAGLSLPQALDILAHQTPAPICQEFQQIVGEYQLGNPLERCLADAKVRLKSENFALFAASMEASRQSGGRLNETVDRIAHSVRELQRLERKVESETAQARSSAFYMALAPIAILTMYWFLVDRENTARLFTTVLGQILLSIALILNVVAYLWARKILNPDL